MRQHAGGSWRRCLAVGLLMRRSLQICAAPMLGTACNSRTAEQCMTLHSRAAGQDVRIGCKGQQGPVGVPPCGIGGWWRRHPPGLVGLASAQPCRAAQPLPPLLFLLDALTDRGKPGEGARGRPQQAEQLSAPWHSKAGWGLDARCTRRSTSPSVRFKRPRIQLGPALEHLRPNRVRPCSPRPCCRWPCQGA